MNETGISERARKVCRGIWDITGGKKHWPVPMLWAAGVLFAILAFFSWWGDYLSLMEGSVDRAAETIAPHIRAVSVALLLAAGACAVAAMIVETQWNKGRQASRKQQESLEEIVKLLAAHKINSWQKVDWLQAELEASLRESRKIRETMGKAAGRAFSVVTVGATAFLLAVSFNKLYDEMPGITDPGEFEQAMNGMFDLVATLFPGLVLIGMVLAAMAGFVVWVFYTGPFFAKIVERQHAIACLWEVRYKNGGGAFPSAPPKGEARPARARKSAQSRRRCGGEER